MAFSVHDDSPVSQLVELSCRVAEANQPNAAEVHVTVMIQPDEIEIGDYGVDIKIRSALICVEPHGCQTDPNTKYGIRQNAATIVKPKKIERKLTKGVSSSIGAEIALGAKFDVLASSVEMNGKASKSRTSNDEIVVTESEEVTDTYLVVEAIGADRWKIENPTLAPLTGSFVSDDRLCRIQKTQSAANRFGATVTLQVKKRHIDAEVTRGGSRVPFVTPNKSKILALMIAKDLQSQAQDRSGELVTFATSELNDEG